MGHHGDRLVSRELVPEEWPRLAGLGACILKRTDADRGVVLVEEWQGVIVGCAVVFQTPDRTAHIDGVWIAPTFRTGRVALRLWRRIQAVLETMGVERANVYPTSRRLHHWACFAGRGRRRLRVKGLFTMEPQMEMSHGS